MINDPKENRQRIRSLAAASLDAIYDNFDDQQYIITAFDITTVGMTRTSNVCRVVKNTL